MGSEGAEKPLRRLAIVGSHPDTRENAPFDDPDFEIWLFNEAPMKPEIYHRWDLCLQIHLPEVYTSAENWVNKDHWEWLQLDHGEGKRIMMHDVDPRIPNSAKYPLEGILKLIPWKYLRSSPAMALALGIYLDYDHIALYGSELTSNTEYRYQAINYAFWIGFALGRGIELDMQCWRNEFVYQPVYGYEGELQIDQGYFVNAHVDLEKRWKYKDNTYQKLQDKLDKELLEAKFDKVAQTALDLETCAINTGEAYGSMKEAERYSERTNQISRQEFERVAAQAQIDGELTARNKNIEWGKSEYVWNSWKQTGMVEAKNQFRAFVDKHTDLAFKEGEHLGIFRENMAYQGEYDKRIQAAGGERAVVYEGRETVRLNDG